jgi:hypothetical protein
MIHITKAKGGFMVITLGLNREVLCITEIFKKKSTAIENILSQSRNFITRNLVSNELQQSNGAMVQDDTLKEPKVYFFYSKNNKAYKYEIPKDYLKQAKIKIKKYK